MTACIEKEIIDNFSRGAKNYDREAYVQGICAQRLAEYIDWRKKDIVDGDILEIGCGTGFVTKEMVRRFPDRNMLITDICPSMLKKCQENVPSCSQLDFSLLDGEKLSHKNSFALIISSLAFQWFRNFSQSVLQLIDGLRPGGLLLFSFLEAKSFPQWQTVCQDLSLPYTGNPLPKTTDLRSVTNCGVSHIWEEEITLVYPNAFQCLKSFKRIGANASLKQRQLTSNQMRRLLHYWNQKSPHGVSITYHIANVAIQKF